MAINASFKKIPTGNQAVDRIQDSVKSSLDNMQNNPISNGQLLLNQSCNSGSFSPINHKLGRKLQGWFISRMQTNAVIWEDTSKATDTTIYLQASTIAEFDLFVF